MLQTNGKQIYMYKLRRVLMFSLSLVNFGQQTAKFWLCVLAHHHGHSLLACSHGGHRTPVNQTLPRVRKWARFLKNLVFNALSKIRKSLLKRGVRKLHIYGCFTTISRLMHEYLQKERSYLTSRNIFKLKRVLHIFFTNLIYFGLQTAEISL